GSLKILRHEPNGFMTILFGDQVISGFVERVEERLRIHDENAKHEFQVRSAALDSMLQGMLKAAGSGGTIELRSPIPGLIKAVRVALNDVVASGQTLAILEAMKMENEIRAPHAGIVERICSSPGQNVSAGTALFVIRSE